MLRLRLSAWLRPLLTLAALAGVLSLAACGGGSGAPNNMFEPTPAGPGPLTITPDAATTYSGNPFTFLITGGTQPYTILSSDQAALPVVGTLTGNSLVVVPGNVGADTTVTLSVRDASGQSTTTAVTVKPSLLLPSSITITGNPNCGSSGATLCSGQDGTASVVVTGTAGAPLAGRTVRFDVVQGDYAISSTAPGQPNVTSLTTVTDQNGAATVRLVVPATAATQIATIRATDVAGGSSVSGQFTIAQFVNGNTVLSIIPTGTTTFTGPDKTRCSSAGRASFYIFGGTPPYTVATNFPQAITITGAPVQRSGSSFTIQTNGTCFEGLTFAITDATGRVLLTPPTVDNVLGTGDPVPVPVPFTAKCPSCGSSTTRVACTGRTFQITVAGTPDFSAVPSDPNVVINSGVPGAGATVTTSPGVFSVSGVPTGTGSSPPTVISLGDASTPQQSTAISIFCNGS
jgi:hypothetical protein